MTATIKTQAESAFEQFNQSFDDARGWFHAWLNENGAVWRSSSDGQKRPKLHFPSQHPYPRLNGYRYFAVDGMGREVSGDQPYECTIHPYTGKFERLCVQTLDSICTLPNSNWDRTIIRQAGPNLLLLALYPRQGINKAKRGKVASWDRQDWLSVLIRWIPASLAITILVS